MRSEGPILRGGIVMFFFFFSDTFFAISGKATESGSLGVVPFGFLVWCVAFFGVFCVAAKESRKEGRKWSR